VESQECFNQAPTLKNPSVLTSTLTPDAEGKLLITTELLGKDDDFDPLAPVFDPPETVGPLEGQFKGTLEIDTEVNAFLYTPPKTPFTEDIVETFRYGLSDNHSDPIVGGTLTVTVSAKPPCDIKLGGDGCFGQTWDGRWFTLDDELHDRVRSVDKKTRVALFHPSKEAYLNPPPFVPTDTGVPPTVFAIFPNPSSARESYWGCGPVNAVASATMASCDLSKSLRGDVTYMLRLPVVKGAILNSSPQVSASDYLGDQYRSYFFALSKTPDTPIDYSGKVPSGEPAGCMGYGKSKSFYSMNCNYLSRLAWSLTETQMLYLKMQAAPGTIFDTTTKTWIGDNRSDCNDDKDCRLYVSAW